MTVNQHLVAARRCHLTWCMQAQHWTVDVHSEGLELSSLSHAHTRPSDGRGRTQSSPADDTVPLSVDTMQHMAVCPVLHALDWQVQAELKEPPDQGRPWEVAASLELGQLHVCSSPQQTAFLQQLMKASKAQKGSPVAGGSAVKYRVGAS